MHTATMKMGSDKLDCDQRRPTGTHLRKNEGWEEATCLSVMLFGSEPESILTTNMSPFTFSSAKGAGSLYLLTLPA